MEKFCVIGGGQAGMQVCAGLRKRNPNAEIILFCAEPYLPYQRPPLSKKYLLGEMDVERLLIRPKEWYDDNNIQVKLSTTVANIQHQERTITTHEGDVYPYDALCLATGSRVRTLPQELTGDAHNVLSIRDIADIDTLHPLMQSGKKVCIVGGGYIGLEAAAVSQKLGLEVTVIEAASRILARVAAPETASYFRDQHQARGVQIIENGSLKSLQQENHCITHVYLADGTRIACDILLVGIGILPNTLLADQIGLDVDQGIMVDAFTRTSDPHIYAAGDCARFVYRGEYVRLESVQNATDQGDCAAANMLGDAQEYHPKPWFWSDQYDTRLQIAGLNTGYNRVITRAGKREGGLSVWYYQDDQLLAVDAMNDTLAYGIGKKILDADKNIPADAVADSTSDLKVFIR